MIFRDEPISSTVLFVDLTNQNLTASARFLKGMNSHNAVDRNQVHPQFLPMSGLSDFPSILEALKKSLETQPSDFVCFVRNGGRLRKLFRDALSAISQDGHSGINYFDEIDATNKGIFFPVQRPVFSPIRFEYQDYLGSLIVVNSDLFFRGGVSESNSLTEWVRNIEATFPGTVRHNQHFVFELEQSIFQPPHEVKPALNSADAQPLISIVMPTRGVSAESESEPIVLSAVKSIINQSTYSNYEFVIVVDAGHQDDLEMRLKEIAGEKVQLVTWSKPFNYSQKMNLGFTYSSGEYLLLLNDDITVISPDWIEQLLRFALRPGIGLVGAQLYFPNNTIQHAGQTMYRGAPSHIGMGHPQDSRGLEDAFKVPREVTGVTAACALISRHNYLQAGGFTSLLPGNFNDVDFCLKIRSLGLQIVITPFAELYHHESISRDSHVHYYELDLLTARWGTQLETDPYWPSHPYKGQRKTKFIDKVIGRGIYRQKLPEVGL
jgi:GT2 family glycosyltransferase